MKGTSVATKTVEQVLQELNRAGLTITDWSRQHGVQSRTVYDVLKGRNLGRCGEGHKVAVLLGMKEGVVSGAV